MAKDLLLERCLHRSLQEKIQVLRWGTSSAGGLSLLDGPGCSRTTFLGAPGQPVPEARDNPQNGPLEGQGTKKLHCEGKLSP